MTPCTGPSLSSSPARAPVTTCGCASRTAEQPAFAYETSYEWESAPHLAYGHGISFDPISDATSPGLGAIVFFSLGWMVFAAVALTSRRRPYVLTLDLCGPRSRRDGAMQVSRVAPQASGWPTASRAFGTT